MGLFDVVAYHEAQQRANINHWANHTFPEEMVQDIVRGAKSRTPSVYERMQKDIGDVFSATSNNLLPLLSNHNLTNDIELKARYTTRKFGIDQASMKMTICGCCDQCDISTGLFNGYKSSQYNHNVQRKKFVYFNKQDERYKYSLPKHMNIKDGWEKISMVCSSCIADLTNDLQPKYDMRKVFHCGQEQEEWMKTMSWAEIACCKYSCCCLVVFTKSISDA
jgi:hypothetical protein